MADGRWDWIEGLKRQSLTETVITEAAKILADEVAAWPPVIDWVDERAAARFAPLYAALAPLPSLDAIEHGFARATLLYLRETDALTRLDRHGPPTSNEIDRLASELLSDWLPEWLYELRERTDGRLPRADLAKIFALAVPRIRARRMLVG